MPPGLHFLLLKLLHRLLLFLLECFIFLIHLLALLLGLLQGLLATFGADVVPAAPSPDTSTGSPDLTFKSSCSKSIVKCFEVCSVQFSSVAQSCLTLCDPMNRSTSGLPVHHQFPEFTQTHVHRISDAIQPSHPLSSPSPPAPNPSQHQSLFQRVNSSHEVARVLEFQL